MGNYISDRSFDPMGKVILSDGTVQVFEQPMTVAELMLEHPQQVVVEFDQKKKKPAPLPADHSLDMRKVYVMLPIKRGKPMSLSSREAEHILRSAKYILKSSSFVPFVGLLPSFARACSASAIIKGFEGKQSLVVAEKKTKEEDEYESLPEIMDVKPEYLSRQMSGKGWKPSLDTIKEKKMENKVPYWLF